MRVGMNVYTYMHMCFYECISIYAHMHIIIYIYVHMYYSLCMSVCMKLYEYFVYARIYV